MLLERPIGNRVRNSILKSLKNGIYTILKLNHKLIWHMNIQREYVNVESRPDIIVNKMEKTEIMIYVAIPGDKRIIDKEKEKI